ncbi:hypothetical protein GobsT_27740 [Gemmata obscuriglobus]|nr:hypothetical protein GobsT_27740 [Gemmata obscuriglobus]VTS05538.1 unnamed protein product [Gemmata obscuriglobus UQM 2246]
MPNPPKMYTVRGETLTLKQCAAKTGVPVTTTNARLKLGCTAENAAVTVAPNRRFRPKVKPVKGPTRPCTTLKTHKATDRAY